MIKNAEFLGPDLNSGMVKTMENGREIMHVDLEKTHFPDNYFDVIMTSEVFEHVARPYKAFQEIYRILKPGGIHVMTVPHHTIAYNDVVYAEMRPNQTDPVLLLEPVYHGEPNPGANNSKGIYINIISEYLYVYMYVGICICMHVYICEYIHGCMCMYTCICLHVGTCIKYTFICVCSYYLSLLCLSIATTI